MLPYSAVFSSPIGKIGFIIHEKQLIRLTLLPESADMANPRDSLSKDLQHEIEAYFKNPKHLFSFPYQIKGTPFQQKIWSALCTIPSGETLTYGNLAKRFQTSPRAIGQACRTNRILLIIPCHRIVAANGIGGFGGEQAGSWFKTKQWLLSHEKVIFN